MFGGNMPSLADIAAVTDNNRNNNNDGMFGGGQWWIIVIILVLFGAFNGNGFGGWGNGYGNNGGGATVVYDTGAGMQRGFDTSQIITKLDGINSGICSLGYDQLAQMNGINTNVMQTGFGIQQAINADTVANMQNTNALMRQADNCCCENRAAIAQVRYDMATESCTTNTNIHQTGDAIIQNQNQNFQMLNNTIKDGFCNLEKQQLLRDNADLRQRLNDCNRDNALQGTANYIISRVNPQAEPAYIVANPNGCNNPIPVQVYNGNSGCGCNSCSNNCNNWG